MSTTPTIGRTVHYVLSEEDAQQINRRRTNGASIAERLTRARWHEGAQAHIGNSAFVGMILPAIVVSSFGDSEDPPINLQVFLDGNDTFWATSRHLRIGDQKGGFWQWPPQAPVPAPLKAVAPPPQPVHLPEEPPAQTEQRSPAPAESPVGETGPTGPTGGLIGVPGAIGTPGKPGPEELPAS